MQEGIDNNHFVQTIIISIVKVPPVNVLISCRCPVKVAVPPRWSACAELGHSSVDKRRRAIVPYSNRNVERRAHFPQLQGLGSDWHFSV